MPEVGKVSKVRVRGLRVRGDNGHLEKAVRESLPEEVTLHQGPVWDGGNSREADVAEGQ